MPTPDTQDDPGGVAVDGYAVAGLALESRAEAQGEPSQEPVPEGTWATPCPRAATVPAFTGWGRAAAGDDQGCITFATVSAEPSCPRRKSTMTTVMTVGLLAPRLPRRIPRRAQPHPIRRALTRRVSFGIPRSTVMILVRSRSSSYRFVLFSFSGPACASVLHRPALNIRVGFSVEWTGAPEGCD